jgi:hypothetical protein
MGGEGARRLPPLRGRRARRRSQPGRRHVEAVFRQMDGRVPVTMVRATRGKWLRAEPVAALYAQGRVRHVGALPELEDELCDFGPDGLSAGRSPDRLDALVSRDHRADARAGGRAAGQGDVRGRNFSDMRPASFSVRPAQGDRERSNSFRGG